jgi:hypothetical protein
MASPDVIATADERPIESAASPGKIPRWVGVVFPAAILGGVGLAAMDAVNQSWLDLVVAIGGAAALGMLTGFIARRGLNGRSRLVRWIVAMGALTVGLSVAGLASGGRIGLRPLLPLLPQFRWSETLQLAVGGLAAWLAVRAFPRAPLPPPAESAPDPSPPAWGFTYHPTVTETQPIRARRSPRPRSLPVDSRRSGSADADGALRRRFRRLQARLAQVAAWRPSLRLRRSHRREAPIRFTGTGEDRCPYCLDIVAENDRRGVTTCPVCHTRHHAECWAVTGTCQMPHLYEGRPATRTGAAR